jgi:hypothetical protein
VLLEYYSGHQMKGIILADNGRDGKYRTQREATIGRPQHRWRNNIKIYCKAN